MSEQHSDELCRQRYDDISRQCAEIKDDIKLIKENHLSHLHEQVTTTKAALTEQMMATKTEFTNRMWELRIAIAVLSLVVLGIKSAEILKIIP